MKAMASVGNFGMDFAVMRKAHHAGGLLLSHLRTRPTALQRSHIAARCLPGTCSLCAVVAKAPEQ